MRESGVFFASFFFCWMLNQVWISLRFIVCVIVDILGWATRHTFEWISWYTVQAFRCGSFQMIGGYTQSITYSYRKWMKNSDSKLCWSIRNVCWCLKTHSPRKEKNRQILCVDDPRQIPHQQIVAVLLLHVSNDLITHYRKLKQNKFGEIRKWLVIHPTQIAISPFTVDFNLWVRHNESKQSGGVFFPFVQSRSCHMFYKLTIWWNDDINHVIFFSLLSNVSVWIQYSSIDTSPLSVNVMHPFWNYLVQVMKADS